MLKKRNIPQVVEHEGQLLLNDPDALAVIKEIAKQNCENTIKNNLDRIVHFKNRVLEKSMNYHEVVVVIANVDTEIGKIIADATMPGFDWQQFRDRNEVPYARGLCLKNGIYEIVNHFDRDEALAMEDYEGYMVVVFDFDVIKTFPYYKISSM